MGLIYGRRHRYEIPQPDGSSKTEELGFRLLTNGGAVVYPFVEDYAEMSLAARLIPLKVADIPTNDKVTVAAEGVATVVIGNDMPSMVAAARYFEGKGNEIVSGLIQRCTREEIDKFERDVYSISGIRRLHSVDDVLAELKQKGYKLIILSNIDNEIIKRSIKC